jgi:hypothetical protein
MISIYAMNIFTVYMMEIYRIEIRCRKSKQNESSTNLEVKDRDGCMGC